MNPETTGESNARGPALTAAAFAGFLVLGTLVYQGLWNNFWYQDDYLWLRIAREIAHSPSFLFVPDVHNGEAVFRLTQRLSMGITFASFGLSAGAFHAASILLQAVASTAVFRLLLVVLRRNPAPGFSAVVWALFGAAVYTASSSHSMAVLWVAAQSTLLATAVAAWLLSVLIQRDARWHHRSTWVIGLGLLWLGLLSKHTVSMVPLAFAAFVALSGSTGLTRRRGWWLAAGLSLLAVVHLTIVKGILPQLNQTLANAIDQGHYVLSWTTGMNLIGAVLGCFLPARSLAATGFEVPFVSLALGWLTVLLLLAWWLRVLRPVGLGLIWIVILVAPTALFDYVQYDADQFTVNRYYHLPMVGAALVMTFLARALVGKLARRGLMVVALVILSLVTIGLHQDRVRADLLQMRTWGETERLFIDRTLDLAATDMAPGTTIYAVNWKMGDTYVDCIDALYFDDTGHSLVGMGEFQRLLRQGPGDPRASRWVSAFDPPTSRFGVMPLSQYLRTMQESARPR